LHLPETPSGCRVPPKRVFTIPKPKLYKLSLY
jgi:hypothetical protein